MKTSIFTILKPELKSFVNQMLLDHDPDLYGQVDSPILNESLIYLEGYYNCILNFLDHSYNENELKELILSEATNFIVKRLKNKR
jgi:hypothetical protein